MSRVTFIATARRLGFLQVELCDRTVPDLDHADATLCELEQHGVRSPSFAIRTDFSSPALRLDEQLDKARIGLDVAARMGARMVRIWIGTSAPSTSAEDRVRNALQALIPLAVKRSLRLAIETHGGISSDVACLMRLLETIDDPTLGVCIDGGYLPGTDLETALDVLDSRVLHIHVKVDDETGPGGPSTDRNQSILRFVRERDYRGLLVVEYEGSGPPLFGIAWARDVLCGIARDDRAG
ncbi:MAG: sugar phosphate isomerase/epimerase family protein [Conexibacter sp.]